MNYYFLNLSFFTLALNFKLLKLNFTIFSGRIPARLNIGLMLFFACFITYMLRVNMSINILGMVKSIPTMDVNGTLHTTDIDVSIELIKIDIILSRRSELAFETIPQNLEAGSGS